MLCAGAAPLKVGTVDITRIFTGYHKTREAQTKINEAKNAALKEFNERADAYQKAVDEIKGFSHQLETTALSADGKARKTRERDEKIEQVQKMEREITAFRQTREQQLQEQILRMKNEILREVTNAVLEIARRKQFDLVLDKSGLSTSGISPLLFSRPSDDFTDE